MSRNYQFGVTYLLSKNKDSGGEREQPVQPRGRVRPIEPRPAPPPGRQLGGAAALGRSSSAASASSPRAGRIGATTGGIDINGDGAAGGRSSDLRRRSALQHRLRVPRHPRRRAHSAQPADAPTPWPASTFAWRRRSRSSGVRIEPSLEVFNVFNRQNYAPNAYNTNLTNARFGLPGSFAVAALPAAPDAARPSHGFLESFPASSSSARCPARDPPACGAFFVAVPGSWSLVRDLVPGAGCTP